MLLKNIHKTNRKIPVLESVFNSEYCKTFKSTHFEEHMRTAASENVFMKLRKIYSSEVLTLKTQVFQHQYQEQVKMFISISRLVSHEVFNYILYFFGVGISLKRGRGIGNGERGMRLTISDKILLSEGAEFIDHSRFL